LYYLFTNKIIAVIIKKKATGCDAMHIYDTLIIGCSYMSAGYAVTRKNCIICEKSELCDTHFGAALCGFEASDYMPCTVEGKTLWHIFSDMKLLGNGMQNLNAFECAFCKYIIDSGLDVLLKSRVVDVAFNGGIYEVTVITNSGLDKLYAKHIRDFSNDGKDYITVQFVSSDIERDIMLLQKEFGEVKTEKAFYDNRYALYVPAGGSDINMLKIDIYNKWHACGTTAKILHIPSAMYSKNGEKLCDEKFDSFIEAFEAGVKEAEK